MSNPTYREMLDDVAMWGRAGYPPVACGRYKDAAERIRALERERDALLVDAKRLDWVDKHLCRAGNVVSADQQVVGIMKCWQVVTQCDDSLRTTIDLLRARIDEEARR